MDRISPFFIFLFPFFWVAPAHPLGLIALRRSWAWFLFQNVAFEFYFTVIISDGVQMDGIKIH